MQSAWEVLAKIKGSELVGTKYEPIFPYFSGMTTAFRVLSDNYVTDDSGTGVVHQVGSFQSVGFFPVVKVWATAQ